MLKRSNFKVMAMVLLLALIFATVASLPTSVLVQNSEMASNAKLKGNNNNHNNNNNFGNPKVKRSSNNLRESPTTAAAAALNNKSSPEMVPESFNAPLQGASSLATSGSSSSTSNSAHQFNAGDSSTTRNGEIIDSAIAAGLRAAAIEAAAAASQRELEAQRQQQQEYVANENASNDGIDPPTLLRKRGISAQQYLYGAGGLGGAGVGAGYGYDFGNPDYYNNPSGPMAGGAAVRDGAVWADEIEPYSDVQDFENYAPRAPYHNKAYDNLQNILNSEAYLEPVALPLQQYPGRYYGAVVDKKKRSNLNKLNKVVDMRLKRDTKLTPADMLALVALVEAGERARQDSDADAAADSKYLTYPEPYNPNNNNNFNPPKTSYYPAAYDYQPTNNLDDVGDYNGGAWLEPAPVVDYYGVPYNLEALPKYELPPREHNRYDNRYPPSKRFMVSKKKRSLGQFLNGPVAKPSFSYNIVKGEKYF